MKLVFTKYYVYSYIIVEQVTRAFCYFSYNYQPLIWNKAKDSLYFILNLK